MNLCQLSHRDNRPPRARKPLWLHEPPIDPLRLHKLARLIARTLWTSSMNSWKCTREAGRAGSAAFTSEWNMSINICAEGEEARSNLSA